MEALINSQKCPLLARARPTRSLPDTFRCPPRWSLQVRSSGPRWAFSRKKTARFLACLLRAAASGQSSRSNPRWRLPRSLPTRVRRMNSNLPSATAPCCRMHWNSLLTPSRPLRVGRVSAAPALEISWRLRSPLPRLDELIKTRLNDKLGWRCETRRSFGCCVWMKAISSGTIMDIDSLSLPWRLLSEFLSLFCPLFDGWILCLKCPRGLIGNYILIISSHELLVNN